MSTWLYSSRSRAQAPRELPRYRPVLEPLEDRRLLAAGSAYQVANLVSDQAGAATIHDPSLIDAQGIALSSAGGAFWVSAHGTGVSTLYTGDVLGRPIAKATLTVTIPGGAPTGQVFNGTGQFVVSSGTAAGTALFIFASDTGHITGWNPAVPLPPPSRVAQVAVATPGAAAYTGITIANNGTGNFLYAVDFRGGQVHVFDATFARTTLPGSFSDPTLPRDFAPFNIQNLGGKLYVTYARQDRHGEPQKNGGFVRVFDTNGNLLDRIGTRSQLRAPYGLALAPADFGEFSNALLVGNHGDGRIDAFDPSTGEFLGELRNARGKRIEIEGLWGLAFGNGVSAGDRNALYFAAGPDDGRHGLFGSIRLVAPPPSAPSRFGSDAALLLSLLRDLGIGVAGSAGNAFGLRPAELVGSASPNGATLTSSALAGASSTTAAAGFLSFRSGGERAVADALFAADRLFAVEGIL